MDVYIGTILFIIGLTIAILYVMHVNETNHQNEIMRINKLEREYASEQMKLDELSKKTNPCTIKGLTNPRSCYFKSQYNCAWNDKIRRCDSL